MLILNNKESYRTTFKSASLFGSLQVFNIFAGFIRGKIIATSLGGSGLGMLNIITSTIAMVSTISGLGLSFSGVRDISIASQSQELTVLSKTVKVFSYWLLMSSIIGAIIVLLGADILSKISFGDSNYRSYYAWLAILVFLTPLNTGYQAIMQGTRRLKGIAKSNLIGSIASVIIILPIYHYLGTRGIVPALIATALISYLARRYYLRKIKLLSVNVTYKETLIQGWKIAKLGITFMFVSLMAAAVIYLSNIYLLKYGSISELGYYRAGLSLTNQAVALVFSAISVDFYPRLSAVSTDNEKVSALINQQSEIILIIITPILIFLMLIAPIMITIFLTAEFNQITTFVRILSFATIIRAWSLPMDLITFAKGENRLTFILAIIGNISMIMSIIIGYRIGGISGIAFAYILHYSIIFIFLNIVFYKKYSFRYLRRANTNAGLCVLFGGLALLAVLSETIKIGNYLAGIMFLISSTYSFYKLNKLVGLKYIFQFLGTQLKRK
jgi:O-antigen/teichoic acid export membrane protein